MIDLYQSQRAMRQMRMAALQKGAIAILDVGSTKIACLVLRFDNSDRERNSDGTGSLAGQSGFQILGAATTQSRGVSFGEIDAMRETERAIRKVLQSAQKMANTPVYQVIVSMAGGNPKSYGLVGSVGIGGGQVSEEDVVRVLSDCNAPNFKETREVLHAQPINFTLDNKSGLSDPRGQVGQKLSADVHLVTVNALAVQNLMRCIERCGLELAGVVSSAYMSGLSSLIEDEQELGAACVDMGGGTTSLSFFLKKKMIYADTVRMGGDKITKDISSALQITSTRAERIKTFYGGVHATNTDDHEHIKIGGDTGEYDCDSRSVSRTELICIIKPRIEEILENVRTALDGAGFYHLPNQQIVLTGGGSQIPGLDALASHILGKQVRLGRPLRVHGLPQATTGAGFSAAVGLCLMAANPKVELWDFDLVAPKIKSKKRAGILIDYGNLSNETERAAYLKGLLEIAIKAPAPKLHTPNGIKKRSGKQVLKRIFKKAYGADPTFQFDCLVDDLVKVVRSMRLLTQSAHRNVKFPLRKAFRKHSVDIDTEVFEHAYDLILRYHVKCKLTEVFVETHTISKPWVDRIVEEIDAIVRTAHFEGLQLTDIDECLIKKALGSLHKDHELSESAYKYVNTY